MNYYERHLGDYAKDTGHLSMLEHGAYTLFLDRYYATEKGIPEDQAHRVSRARTKEEKEAVNNVLNEYFVLVDGIWINNRAEEEIEKARIKIEASRKNGQKGGRPKKETKSKPEETQQKPTGFSPGSETETQQKAHQTPDTISTKSIASESAVLDPPTGTAAPPGRNIEIAILLRRLGVKPMTAQHPLAVELSGNPKAADEILRAAVEHVRQRKPEGDIHPNYLATVLPDYLDPKPKSAVNGNWRSSNEGIERMGKELGLTPKIGESYPDYARRIDAVIESKRREAAA